MINGPDVLVAAGKELFKPMKGFVYEPTPPDHSPSMMGRYSRNTSQMRSRLDTHQDDIASRLKRKRERMMKTSKMFINSLW